MLNLPQELWDLVIPSLNSFSARYAAEAFRFSLGAADYKHEALWRTIFKNETWLQLAVERFGVNPVLISPDLDTCTDYEKVQSTYMILLADDIHGDIQYTSRLFFDSLQDHTYNNEHKEVVLASGITVNLQQLLSFNQDGVVLTDTLAIFEKDRPRTSYIVWLDVQRSIRYIEPPNIIGIGGSLTQLAEVSPICCLELPFWPTIPLICSCGGTCGRPI